MIPNYPRLRKMLIQDEGTGKNGQMFYFCPAGCLTFGVGRNVDANPFTKQERIIGRSQGLTAMSDLCLLHDAEQAFRQVTDLFGWNVVLDWHERRIHAVINAMFCLGPTRFRRFVRMIQAIQDNSWTEAAYHLCDSKWARDWPNRPERLAREYRLDDDSDYEE